MIAGFFSSDIENSASWFSLKLVAPISPHDEIRLANSSNRPVANYSILGLLRLLQSSV